MYGASEYSMTPYRSDRDHLGRDIVRVVLTVLFPPLGVFLKVRFTAHLMISVLLTLFGYVPGLVHAIWVLAKRREDLWPWTR